jgi:hypothetical protein
MTETLLTPSSIKIYGRVLSDLSFNYASDTVSIGGNNFLQQQLSPPSVAFTGNTTNASQDVTAMSTLWGISPGMSITTTANNVFTNKATTVLIVTPPATITVQDAAAAGAGNGQSMTAYWQIHLARIYAFSFEGAVYSLPKPSIFLMHGQGWPIDATANRTSIDEAGVAAREWEFSGPSRDRLKKPTQDLVYWEYEKGDFSLRLDTEAGPLEQILLAAAIRGADMGDRSGANLGIRSGANLSGANLSGANVSGANVSGANLSGANLRNR